MTSQTAEQIRSASIDSDRIAFLEEKARQIRLDIVRMAYACGQERRGHPGPALSIADMVTALFFDIMRIDPKNPKWPDRDRFVLSKGHACPVLYAALANRGYFDKEELKAFRHVNAMLQGHPDMKGTPGVDMTAGSLGHGLAAGLGIALSADIDKKDYRVFVIIGDGECQEGLIWEAAMAAPRFLLGNLIALVDWNEWQSCGKVCETMPLFPFVEKWRSFGWNTIEIDGHDMHQIVCALEIATQRKQQPSVIIANTVKGKGVSYMENDNSWHQKAPTKEQFEIALRELGGEANE